MRNKGSIMVCITAQEVCEEIIIKAREMAGHLLCNIDVVTVQPKKASAQVRSRDMKILEQLAKKINEPITIIYSDNPLVSLSNHAKETTPIHIFTGVQNEDSGFIGNLAMFCDSPVSMVSKSMVCTMPAPSVMAGNLMPI